MKSMIFHVMLTFRRIIQGILRFVAGLSTIGELFVILVPMFSKTAHFDFIAIVAFFVLAVASSWLSMKYDTILLKLNPTGTTLILH